MYMKSLLTPPSAALAEQDGSKIFGGALGYGGRRNKMVFGKNTPPSEDNDASDMSDTFDCDNPYSPRNNRRASKRTRRQRGDAAGSAP